MKKIKQNFRTRMGRAHVQERKAKSRSIAARRFMSWQNRDRLPKPIRPPRGRRRSGGNPFSIMAGGGILSAMAGLMGGAMMPGRQMGKTHLINRIREDYRND